MRHLVLVPALAVVVLGAVGIARAEPRADPAAAAAQELVRTLDEARASGARPDVETAKRVAELAAKATASRTGMAELIDSGRFEVKTSAGAKATWPGGEAGVEVSGGTMTGSLPLSPITSLQTSVGERKLGAGTSTKLIDYAGVSVKVGGGVEAEYETNKDFYAALPVPGLRQMHAILDRKLSEYEKTASDDAGSRLSDGWGAARALEAAATEAAESFRASMGWVAPKQAAFKSDVSVSAGAVEVSASQSATFDFARPDLLLRPTSDVTLKVSHEAALGGGGEAGGHGFSAGAGLAFTYKFDGEAKPSAEAHELAEAFRRGDDARVRHLVVKNMGPIALTEADFAMAKDVWKNAKESWSLAADQVVSTVDPIGGVSLHFSPTILGSGVTPADYGQMLHELSRAREEGRKTFALQPAEVASLVRVPLSRLESAADLGLTRVRGYVATKDGALSLVGEVEPGRPAIPRDDLVVAVRSILLEGTSPYVSLDPDPDDFAGAQKARVGGVPKALEKSAFVRTMLEADYLMKRLDLGALKVSVPGYRSTVDLLETWPDPPGDLMSRLWLVPEVAPVGDLYDHEDARGRVTLFRSRIRVMTETLKRAGSTLVGAGVSHPMADAAASSLTAHLPALARLPECEAFRRLEQVFDVAKLCAVWRDRKVDHPTIRKLAAIEPAVVEIPRQYPGIGPVPVRGGRYSLSGGASGRARLNERVPHALPALGALLSAGETAVELPATLPLDGSELQHVDAELLANAAFEELSHGKYEEAVSRLDRALKEDPELDLARAYRALARFALGDLEPALQDVDAAVARNPSLRGLKAVVEAAAGRTSAALEDCAAFEARFPDDVDVLAIAAQARLMSADFAGADRLAQRLAAAAPLSHDALVMRDLVEAVWRGGPKDAPRRVAAMRGIPLAIQSAVALGQEAMAGFGFDAAVEQFRTAYEAARRDTRTPRSLYVRELCAFLLSTALEQAASFHRKLDPEAARREDEEARRIADDLAKEHPDWPSVALARAQHAGPGVTLKDRLDALEAAIAPSAVDDPLLAELQRSLGTNRAAALFAISMFKDMGESRQEPSPEQVTRFVHLIVRALGDAPEAGPYRRLADLAERALKDPQHRDPTPQEFRGFLESILAVPLPWPDDAVSVVALANLHVMGLGMTGAFGEGRSNPNRDLAEAFAQRFLEGARVNGLREGVLKKVATLYWTVTMVVTQTIVTGFQKSAEYKALEARLATEIPDLEAFRAEVRAALDRHLDTVRPKYPPFALAMASGTGFTSLSTAGYERDLIEAFQRSIDGRPEAERERAREVVERWEKAIRPGPANPFEGNAFADLAEQATCEVELAAVTNMLEMFDMVGNTISQADGNAGEMLRKIRAVKEAVQNRIRGRVFEKPSHDWEAWGSGHAGPASAGATAAGAGGSGGGGGFGVPIPLLLAGVVGAVGLALVLLSRRRRPPTAG
jgi:tetratricopeptide (TPR) repeat protein